MEVEEAVVGRGLHRRHHRDGGRGRRLNIEVPDSWMSSQHFRLVKRAGDWVLIDAGSKNGTYVNGWRATEEVSLSDGDLIEAGNSLLLFRSEVRRGVLDPADLDSTSIHAEREPLFTLSIPLARDFAALRRVAPASVPVVLLGETGTGKEVMARTLHRLSGRPGEFVAINCGALPDNLVESELFGHRKGAFSGATEDRPGLVRAADRGTLFLDEIAELPESSQVKLLRVLQENEVTPIGGTRPTKVDVRVVAATHQNLPRLVERGLFRSDLYGRIAGFQLMLPPLRERREDIGILVAAMLPQLVGERQAREIRLQRSAARALFTYHWPRNIRELEQALALACTLADGVQISLDDLPEVVRASQDEDAPAVSSLPAPGDDLDLDRVLRDRLLRLLREHNGNVSAVARDMGKARVQIRRWCKRLNLDPDSYRD
jgi:DNA-binding NtrC family response regulator